MKIELKLKHCRTFAAGNKIKQFYELLVEDSLQREDVENMSRLATNADMDKAGKIFHVSLNLSKSTLRSVEQH